MSEQTHEVATTIAAQIGNQAFAMMGTRYKVASENGDLTFDVRGSREINKIRVSLDPTDTYTVRFYWIKGAKISERGEVSGVYADSLRSVIESRTGLCLSL